MKRYLVYDKRAYSEETDKATILCCADTLEEARQDRDEMFPESPIFEYTDLGDDYSTETLVE